jgi:eukaryotic-like serine/threonine-protein kinase
VPNDDLDIALARFVKQTGLATPDQVADAMQIQARSHQAGNPISLSEALVQKGILTAAQRETVEKKAQAQAGAQQLLHYKLLKKLGEGGMGAVYLAEDTQQGVKVAVKVLPRKYAAEAELLKRFRREADAAGQLKHPNIVGAYRFGEDRGFHFYVMEYCEGETLDATLKREQRLAIHRAIDLTLQAARGLKYAHDQGFIHRDIKPANIIVTREETAKILDLGLSKNLEESEKSFKTVSGAVLGTPHYISPEQAQGEKAIDGRTDLYSLGATFYHLLTGQTPFDGTTIFEILSKQVTAQLPNPQDLREEIPDAAVHVLRRMMAKAPADRYRDCGELIEDLEQLRSGKVPATKILDPALSAVALVRKRPVGRRPSTLRRAAPKPGSRSRRRWSSSCPSFSPERAIRRRKSRFRRPPSRRPRRSRLPATRGRKRSTSSGWSIPPRTSWRESGGSGRESSNATLRATRGWSFRTGCPKSTTSGSS